MNDFDGLFTSDYGFKPQGKTAPMAAARSSSTKSPGYNSFMDGDGPIFNPSRGGKGQGSGSVDGFGDAFGGPPKYSSSPDNRRRGEEFDLDDVFGGVTADAEGSGPVFDKPVFVDEVEDVFAGMKGSSPANFENVFASMGSPENGSNSSQFDDLLGIGGNSGRGAGRSKSFKKDEVDSFKESSDDFDDLLPGFGVSSPPSARDTTGSTSKRSSHVKEDTCSGIDSPLVHADSGNFVDPLEEIRSSVTKETRWLMTHQLDYLMMCIPLIGMRKKAHH